MAKVTKKAKPVAKKVAAKKPAAKAVKAVATKKTAPKKAVAKAKPAPKKVVVKTKTKAVAKPTKKVAAPTKKTVAPAKKAVAKTKPAPKKATTKPVAKKVAAKPVPAKKAAKPAPKKVVAKPAPKKTTTKPAVKKAVAKKPVVAKTTTPKVVIVKKQAPKANVKAVAPKPEKLKQNTVKPIHQAAAEKAHQLSATRHQQEAKPVMEVKVVRYSDADLSVFKEVILKKIVKAKEEIDFYTDQIKNASESETQFASIDDGSITSERENMNQIVARMLKLISHLESALVRIENKSYGICRETGKLIPKERLMVVPHATLSVEGKKMEKK